MFFRAWAFMAGLAAALACGGVRAQPVDQAVAAYYPPLMIEPTGERPGTSVEILREAARRLGRAIELEFLPLRRALKTVRERDDTLQPAFYRNATREPDYQWIAHTHDVENVFLTLGAPVNTLEEARALERIGVETDAAMDVMLTRLGFTNLERVDRPEVNAAKLRAGRLQAWALTRSLARWTWRNLDFREQLVAGAPVETGAVWVVAGPRFPADLALRYRDAIGDMKRDGTLARILQRYGE